MKYVYFTCMIIMSINYVATNAESNFIENDAVFSDSDDTIPLLIKRIDKKIREMGNEQLLHYIGDDHFMMRKSQRSPSLRLRFGRSSPNSDIQRMFKFKNLMQYNQNQEY